MVDRAVRIDWVLLAASGMATGPDAEPSGARDAGRHGVAHCVLPMLSLVVLSRVAGVHWSARRLLSNGGEARGMIETNLSASTAIDRPLLPATGIARNRKRSLGIVRHRSKRPSYPSKRPFTIDRRLSRSSRLLDEVHHDAAKSTRHGFFNYNHDSRGRRLRN